MSSQLLWELVKKNTCFIKKGLHGEFFTTEPGNLYSKHSYKYSGLANKAVDVTAGKGTELVLVKGRAKNANKPTAAVQKVALKKKQFPRQLAAIGKEVGNLRADLKLAALRKASALHRSQVKAAAAKLS